MLLIFQLIDEGSDGDEGGPTQDALVQTEVILVSAKGLALVAVKITEI